MKPLVDLTSRALARLIEGKTPEQVRCMLPCPGKAQICTAWLPSVLHQEEEWQAWPQHTSTAIRPELFYPGLLLVAAVAYTSRGVDNGLTFSHEWELDQLSGLSGLVV